MQWFRMYSEARNDAKLRYLSDAEFRVWFNLLCLANEQEERGTILPMSRKLLSVEVAGGDEELLAATLEKLTELSIIAEDDNGVTFLNFRKRQYDKPSDTPEATRERKRRSRAKQKVEEDVTSLSRDVTRCHTLYTDTDTDTDTDINTSTSPPPSLAPNGAGEGGSEKESTPPKTIDDLIDEATRYTTEQQAIIRDYWDTVRFTRRRGEVAPSIVKTELEYWEKFPPDIVLEALGIHIAQCRDKREEYTRGIMRRLQEERRNGNDRDFNRSAGSGKNYSKSGNGAGTRGARPSTSDYTRGEYGAIFRRKSSHPHSAISKELEAQGVC